MLDFNNFSNIERSEFAFKRYPKKSCGEKILFEILVSPREKFVAKFSEAEFQKLLMRKKCETENYYFFGEEDIKGEISIYEILHDAIPLCSTLDGFFEKSEKSKYKEKEDYPIGLAGGEIILGEPRKKSIYVNLESINKKIGGAYIIKNEEKNYISLEQF